MKVLKYEDRPEQENIMWEIIDSLEFNKNYLIEAGVGIGKSFAYLIPGILLSRYTGKPLIVATSTIHLSLQLEKDVKYVQEILEPVLGDGQIDVVVGKGRTNYPCTHKIQAIIERDKETNPVNAAKYEEILRKVKNGADRQNKMGIDDNIWNEITEHSCDEDTSFIRANCPFYEMRSNLKEPLEPTYRINDSGIQLFEPKVLVINQDLLMGHIKNISEGKGAILPSDIHLLVIDEVHNLEDKARTALTTVIDKKTINKLFSDVRKLFNNSYEKQRILSYLAMLENNIFQFYDDLSIKLIDQSKDEDYSDRKDHLFIPTPDEKFNKLGSDLEELQRIIENSITLGNSYKYDMDYFTEQTIINIERIATFIYALYDEDDEFICWGEVYKNKKCTFYICPDTVANTINETIFSKPFTTIGLSATITNLNETNEPSYDYLESNIGFKGETTDPKISPFDYDKSRLFIPERLPYYKDRDKDSDYFQFIADIISRISMDIQGGTLVLFTAKNELELVYECLDSKGLNKEIYKGMSSDQTNDILNKFKQSKGIILGTGTFWEGLDLKGDYLTNLIIVRLPYPVPSPILDRKVKQSSESEVYVPEMITKLRQGTGRLIRSKKDIGVCTILDSRMNEKEATKQLVLASLPFKEVITNFEELKRFQENNNI